MQFQGDFANRISMWVLNAIWQQMAHIVQIYLLVFTFLNGGKVSPLLWCLQFDIAIIQKWHKCFCFLRHQVPFVCCFSIRALFSNFFTHFNIFWMVVACKIATRLAYALYLAVLMRKSAHFVPKRHSAVTWHFTRARTRTHKAPKALEE